MAANNALQLSSINFDGIKSNLKAFLQNQTELEDYDYESSTMQILLNLLAYNTYMNSYYLNMVGNEMFLDSAQIRTNVVSRAKMLGYTPRSARGATATVQVTITPGDSPSTITIDKNKRFRATIDGTNYIFVNPDAKVINANPQGIFSTNIDIVEGQPLTHRYTVSSVNPVRYVIPNDNVDTTGITVRVQESSANSSVTTYTLASDLINVTGDSTVYFLDENIDGRYELTFGDNVLGKQLNDGNVVNIDYRVCNGVDARGASVFSAVDQIDGYSDITTATVSAAQGGASKENIQSIKYNAPKNYQAQNRAVTRKDYETLVKNFFADIQAVSVWGGEDNTPPIYGKVYLSVKPRSSLLLAEDRKQNIVDYLVEKNVLTIEPELVDPTYVYVRPQVTVKYNPDLTSLSSGAMVNAITNGIINYEANKLGLFAQSYIGSDLGRDIYNLSDAITSVSTDITIKKKIVPNTTVRTTYRIPFNRPLLNITGGAGLRISPASHPGQGLTLSSTAFTYNGRIKTYFDDDGFGNVRTYYVNPNGIKIYTNRLAGTIDYLTGTVILNDILITDYEGDALEIIVDPDTSDIDPLRNQLLLIADATVSLYDTKLKSTVATVSSINTEGATTTIPETGVVSTVY